MWCAGYLPIKEIEDSHLGNELVGHVLAIAPLPGYGPRWQTQPPIRVPQPGNGVLESDKFGPARLRMRIVVLNRLFSDSVEYRNSNAEWKNPLVSE